MKINCDTNLIDIYVTLNFEWGLYTSSQQATNNNINIKGKQYEMVI